MAVKKNTKSEAQAEASSPALWELYRDGKRMQYTNYEECIPPKEILLAMQAAGYQHRKNGKVWKVK